MKQQSPALPSGGGFDLDVNVARAVLAHIEAMGAPEGSAQEKRALRRRRHALASLDRRQAGYLAVVGGALRRLAERQERRTTLVHRK